MKIACLSGKGGAGKTFVAVNLASAAASSGDVTYIDCDVEEPNGHIFLKPEITEIKPVSKILPAFDTDKCTSCRKCADFCHFHALMFIKGKPKLFDELCHSCGGCELVCEAKAVSEEEKLIGRLELGNTKLEEDISVKTVTGILNTGEASGIPIINKALEEAKSKINIIDCPPGSACSVMESIIDADYCIIVAEPTAFGFHNFKMVYELTSILGKKTGVLINKESKLYEPLEDFLKEHEIKLLGRIPFDEELGALMAEGKLAYKYSDKARKIFDELYTKLGGEL
ncbi:MAG: ATP-binding protein [Eubacteriales bacterium]|nr:ATP-binding protein [Eubacteriales bacterium]